MSTPTSAGSIDWSAVVSTQARQTRERLARSTFAGAPRRPAAVPSAPAAPRSLAAQTNLDWRADIAVSRYDVAWRVAGRVGPNHDA